MKHFKVVIALLVSVFFMQCQPKVEGLAKAIEIGPYTVTEIGPGVYNIAECTAANPAGAQLDSTGKIIGYNNVSDIYLVVGNEKALLIDLANNQQRKDSTANESLRKIFYDRAKGKEKIITITHAHGDHVGMMPAFIDEKDVHFWVPAADFKGQESFPKERTEFFEDGASVDLGGRIVSSLLLPGHTIGSTVFFLPDQNYIFSGDALGSGNGVWLFNYDGFIEYKKSISKLIDYIEDKSHGLDLTKVILWGGHYFQKGDVEELNINYIYDMRTLIRLMGFGRAEGIPTNNTGHAGYLNTNFKYSSAVITWNDEDCKRYQEEVRANGDVAGNGTTHKNNSWAMLSLFDEVVFKSVDDKVGDMLYYLYDPIKHGADPTKKYPLIVVFHGKGNGTEGVYCAAHTDCACYAGEEYQNMLGGAYLLFPKANENKENLVANCKYVGPWITQDSKTGTSVYIPSVAALIDSVIAGHSIDPKKVAVGGTSAGGYMAWRFMAVHPEMVKAAFLMAPANNPSDKELKTYEEMNIPIWVIHGRQDELCPYGMFTGPVADKLRSMKNVRLSVIDVVRYGDKSVVVMPGGLEMGQHLALFCVGSNMLYDDGTPYDPQYPEGFIAWLNDSFEASAAR